MKIKILQKIADLIIFHLRDSVFKNEFEFWMYLGVSLNFWCVENNIYLN
jgi:hypothetical protein